MYLLQGMDETKTQRSPLWQPRTSARVALSVVEGPDSGLTIESDERSITVGGSADNDLVLHDPTVSRYHLELTRSQQGVHVRDLGSLNGTFLGSARVHEITLPVPSRLQVGQSLVEIADGSMGLAPDTDAPDIPGLVYESPLMAEVGVTLRKLASVDVSVLLQGETGTGKEVLARALHGLSARRDKPFEVVDCGSMPATLIASELFGHERGAFTGADRQHKGAFERVGDGTLFLDEVGELPLELQSSLLGVVERRQFRRVGGTKELKVAARLVSATHRDLRAAVNEGRFRADLYFRLAASRIMVPPLRERPEDIDLLIRHFVLEATGSARIPFGAMALEALRQHRWTGNVRELRNAIETALILGAVELEDGATSDRVEVGMETIPYKKARESALHRFERRYFTELMDKCEGNASKAARESKMDRPYMLSILKRHGLR